MHDLIRKPMTVALAAVLLFCTVAPVPTGVAMFDRARVNHAYANPVAATAAEMALYAIQACCIAGGIYIAGTTISEFNINSQEIYDAFTDYYTTQNDISASELEAILAGSYTNGYIDLSALTAAGITGAIPGFAQVLMNGGNAAIGANSASSNVTTVELAGNTLPAAKLPENASMITPPAGTTIMYYETSTSSWWITYRYYSVASSEVYFQESQVTGNNLQVKANSGNITWYEQVVNVRRSDGYTEVTGNTTTHTAEKLNANIDGSKRFLNVDYPWSSATGINVGVTSGVAAVIADGVTAGTFAGTNQGIVQAFNPTAEQLQAGYDASILQGVEQAVADLGTISTGIAALDATLNGLLGVCQGIASTLSNTVVGQYCAAVTQWLGATPFGTVMGTVIDGLDAIPDSVADGAAVVAGGVAALPGALEGVIEGVLEGVFGQPLAIPGFLQDILAGVQAIPGALEGAIEGITFPEWRWPEAPEIPRVDGEPVPLALSGDLIADMQSDLRDKVPFCYLIRLGESFGIMFSNFQTSRSFYFDLDVPNAGSVHFDGESFLNQPLLGSNVADVIRICVTALLCTGLLYGAYKVAREL